MKRVKITTELNVDASIDGKSINEFLRQISEDCHSGLEDSSSENEECERLYEDQEYEELYAKMQSRVSSLEGVLCRILDYLGD